MINGRKRIVRSPYWEENDFVNPHFPYGCTRGQNAYLMSKEYRCVPREQNGNISNKRKRLNELRKAKAECINMNNLTTVYRGSLDPRIRI